MTYDLWHMTAWQTITFELTHENKSCLACPKFTHVTHSVTHMTHLTHVNIQTFKQLRFYLVGRWSQIFLDRLDCLPTNIENRSVESETNDWTLIWSKQHWIISRFPKWQLMTHLRIPKSRLIVLLMIIKWPTNYLKRHQNNPWMIPSP